MLTLESPVLADLRAHWESAYPLEACGLLLGTVIPSGRIACRAWPTRNVAPDDRRRRFQVAAQDLIDAGSWARDAGLELIGVHHSHPDVAATPSGRDRVAAQRGWSHVIASVRGDGRVGTVVEVASWAISGGSDDLTREALRSLVRQRAG